MNMYAFVRGKDMFAILHVYVNTIVYASMRNKFLECILVFLCIHVYNVSVYASARNKGPSCVYSSVGMHSCIYMHVQIRT